MYDGESSFYREEDLCRPVNHYGKTKVQAEECIKVTLSKTECLCQATIDDGFGSVYVEQLRHSAIQSHLWQATCRKERRSEVLGFCGVMDCFRTRQ